MKKEAVGRTIGEFLLIVVGVLAALAAESWLEDSAERRLGDAYVAALLVDVVEDSVQIDSWRRLGDSRIEALSGLLRTLNG
ncbi:MAG: hypothetical protein ACR2QM_06305, partial [Longimicrobiales bacterium]